MIDRFFQHGPSVIGHVNLPCQRDEAGAEIAPRLMCADGTFGVPKLAIDQFEFS